MGDLRSQNAVILDFQTTGSSAEHHHIIEMGYCLYQGSEQSQDLMVHSQLVRLPEDEEVPRRVKQLTGISSEMLDEDGVDLESTFGGWPIISGDQPLIIHYAQFERPFLKALVGEDLPPIICTHKVAKRLFPELPSKSLRGVSGFLGYPIGELKRSAHHIEASLYIWQKMVPLLLELGLNTYEDVIAWLDRTKAPKADRAFAITAEKRLALPAVPGIYRMLDGKGSILYIGKAKNLKTRVSSYFTGKKTKGSRLNEMLSQVKDIKVTKTLSACHAAVLEADLIKRHHPPYNRALKAVEDVAPCFGLADFSLSLDHDAAVYGPFRSPSFIEYFNSVRALILGLEESKLDIGELEAEVLVDGIQLFKDEYGDDEGGFDWGRIILLAWQASIEKSRLARKLKAEGLLDEEEEEDEAGEDDEEERVWTSEDVLRHIRRTMAGFGHRIHRGRWLMRLANCHIVLTKKVLTKKVATKKSQTKKVSKVEHIMVVRGQVSFYSDLEKHGPLGPLSLADKRGLFEQVSFDRLSVLMTELRRLVQEDADMELSYHGGAALDKNAIKSHIFPELCFADS